MTVALLYWSSLTAPLDYGPEDGELEVEEDDEEFSFSSRELFYNQLRKQLPDRVTGELVDVYQKKLMDAATNEPIEFGTLTSREDFRHTLKDCVQRALDNMRLEFDHEHQLKSSGPEGRKESTSDDSSKGGLGEQPSANMQMQNESALAAFPHPNDWVFDATLPNDFSFEDPVQEWGEHGFNLPRLGSQFSGDLSDPCGRSLITSMSENLTLELPCSHDDPAKSHLHALLPSHGLGTHNVRMGEGDEQDHFQIANYRTYESLFEKEDDLDNIESERQPSNTYGCLH